MSLQKNIEELLLRVNNLNEALDEQKKRKNKIEELISATKKRSNPERKQKEAVVAAIEEEVNAILLSAARYVTISSALPIRAKEHRVADLRIAQSELSDSGISREVRERKAFEIVRNAKAYLKYLEIEKERISEEERAKREEEIKSYRERIELGESRIRSLVQQIQKWISQSGIRIAYQSINIGERIGSCYE